MSEYPWFDFDQVDFVTSDQHFGHARISELAERPFATVEEMNAELARRWNDVVGPDGFVNVLWPRDGLIWPIQDGVF